MERYTRPVQTLMDQNKFGTREVGFTHPDNASFGRIRDDGSITLSTGPGCAIHLSADGILTFIGREIRFLTAPGNTIRWNNKRFNSHASNFAQPPLLPMEEQEVHGNYDGADDYYETSS